VSSKLSIGGKWEWAGGENKGVFAAIFFAIFFSLCIGKDN
jgi:hypothetical protein